MKAGFFVAGTDTGVGKTMFSAALLRSFAARGLRSAGMKPVAAGCEGGRNEDVEALLAASSVELDRKRVCPYLFEPPIAPHIAAREAGVTIDLSVIDVAFRALQEKADVVVVEGVGGFSHGLNPLPREVRREDLPRGSWWLRTVHWSSPVGLDRGVGWIAFLRPAAGRAPVDAYVHSGDVYCRLGRIEPPAASR